MKYSAGKAAQATGLATSTITRALKSGKISGERQEGGGWLIDPAELHRVFPPVAAQGSQATPLLGSATPNLDSRNSGLERLVESLQEQLADVRASSARALVDLRADKDQVIGLLQQDRDNWQQQAQTLLRQLPPPVPDAPALGQGKPVGGFWARLWGKTPSNV